MSDNTVYYKDDKGNFIPFGIEYGHNYIPDGIWSVKHDEYSSSITNIDYIRGLYKLHDFEDISIQELCSLHSYSDYIFHSNEYSELMKRSFTTQEYVSCIISLIFKRNKELQKNNPNNTII